ncbi:hypothetical protein [Nonomuraea sp. NPDC049607]|uniref:hypothetical protein n=1 Tax=Nonomuraea sp. NPDC049607 TaxID=3154732 RepID=UPI00344487FB
MHQDIDGFYSWAACDQYGRGSCGITGEAAQAAALLRRALESLAPGATGSVQLVHLDRYASNPSYIYGAIVLRLHSAKTTVANG